VKHNSPCHIEIEVSDLGRSQEFNSALFGWRFSPFIPNMVVFGVGDEHFGGLMKVERVEPGRSPSVWFRVKDLDASVALDTANGGSSLEPKGEVPGLGWSAVVTDPDGNRVRLVVHTGDA
jgi:predicted enzyme related to lactoylglutathione lyase